MIKRKRITNLIFLVILVALVVSLIRNIVVLRQADESIRLEQEKLTKLEKEKAEKEARLAEITGNLYIEKEVRDKLGYAYEDELVIVLPDDETLRKLSPRKSSETKGEELIPNWKKWFNLFFEI